jgi:uncharacterized protein DUF3105
MVSKIEAHTRRERAAQVRAQARRAERRRRTVRSVLLGAVALAAAGGITAGVVLSRGGGGTPRIEGVTSFGHLTRNHVQGTVKYAQTPPVGGDHSPVWLNCGIYGKPVPNENAVHDMEHGAVWITYRPGLPAAQLAALKSQARARTFVDLSPYPGLPAPVVVSAWGKQLRLPSAGDPRLEAFISAYRQGPQTPEPGAPCTGGVGTPEK